MKCNALILSGYGINCENETRYAIQKSKGNAEIVHINRLIANPNMLDSYNFLVIPGGSSFGDFLGAGKMLANRLMRLKDQLRNFAENEKLVLGIGNGFQVLVRMGLLPMPDFTQRVTFAKNDSGRFEDRWVFMKINKKSPCIFTAGMEYSFLPVRHNEGKFMTKDNAVAQQLVNDELITMQYVDSKGNPGEYPANPNGSEMNVAGICDRTGYIFGLMPHPEAFNSVENCPYWTLGTIKEAHGLRFFQNAVRYLEVLE